MSPVRLDSGLSSEQLDQLTAYMDGLPGLVPHVTLSRPDLILDPLVSAVVDTLCALVLRVNQESFRFDLDPMGFTLQRNVYQQGANCIWHIDLPESDSLEDVTLKLGLSLQLSDPSDYDGGIFYAWANDHRPVSYPAARGAAIVYPSCVLHHVSPVTRGSRKSFMVLARGPRFR